MNRPKDLSEWWGIIGHFVHVALNTDSREATLQVKPFHGYFFLNPATGDLEGRLNDGVENPSEIRGRMVNGSLEFEKTYEGTKNTFSYRYRKDDGNWVGHYFGENLGTIFKNEVTVCKTIKMLEDLDKYNIFPEGV